MRLILTLLTLITPTQAFTQPDSGFTWVHPYPLGDNLTDVLWVGPSEFVAVSDNGFIYRTEDAGRSWQPVFSSLNSILECVTGRPGLVLVAGANDKVHRSSDNGRTWDIGEISGFNQTITDIELIGEKTIFAVGGNLSFSGHMAKSVDAGVSWTIIDPDLVVSFSSVDFVDSLHGFATGEPGMLIRTSDGGATWSRDTNAVLGGPKLDVVSFRNMDTGVVAGDNGLILITDDGGETWTSVERLSQSSFYDAVWCNDSTVIVVGLREQAISRDAGKSWSNLHLGWSFSGVSFDQSGEEGLAVGLGGEVQHSSNGGERWQSRWQSALMFNILDLDFLDPSRAIAVGYGGGVLYTQDSGRSWSRTTIVHEQPPVHLRKVVYPAIGHAVAFAPEGYVYYSSNGGKSWREAVAKLRGFVYEVSFADSLTGWIVGDRQVLKSNDGGLFWTTDSTSISARLWAVDAVTRSLVFATGDDGRLFRSTDGGGAWSEIENDFTVRFTMVKADTLGNITLGWNGGLVHSTDNGISWEDNPAPDGSNLQNFSFVSPFHGWCGHETGPMQITTDAGKSWSAAEHGLRLSPSGFAAMSVVEMLEPGFGYLAGSSSYILQYRDSRISDVPEDDRLQGESGPVQSVVMPNPLTSTGMLVFDLTERTSLRIDLYDVLGRTVQVSAFSAQPGPVQSPISGAGLSGGIYFYRVFREDGKLLATGSFHVTSE